MRILYVEDDDNLAFAVERMLRQDGHLCDRVRSGAGAVKLGQTNDYDVILLDVMLPDIDGYDVIRLLQGAGVDTPVLIQSGLVERDRAMDGLGFGVDDYLIKPFNRDELISQVRRAAARSGRLPPSAANLPAVMASNGIAETTSEAPADSVIALRDETVAEPAEKPVETVPETAAETAAETVADTAADKVAETTADNAAEKVTETTAETAAEKVTESTAETATEKVAETTAKPTTETAADTVADANAEAATEMSAETAVETETAVAAEELPLPDSFPALPAKIVADDGRIDIDCIVISVTSGGAVLNVHDEQVVCPDDFKLAVAGDRSFRCQSCWRHGDKVGVKFL